MWNLLSFIIIGILKVIYDKDVTKILIQWQYTVVIQLHMKIYNQWLGLLNARL